MDCDYYKWFPYYEFPDRYDINMMGHVRNRKSGMVLSGSIRKSDGYLYYGLKDESGKTCTRAAHIMVARQFIPNDDKSLIVNHIDENKSNPCIDNLEWITLSENSLHGTGQIRKSNKILKPVNEYSKDGEYIRTWKSIKSIVEYIEGSEIQDTRTNKTYNRIRVIGEKNAKEEKKRLVYDRIFIVMGEKVDTSNLFRFSLAMDKNNQLDKRKDIFLDDKLIPSKFLYFATSEKQYTVKILNNIKSRLVDNDELAAITYAIKCVIMMKKGKED